MAGNSGPFRWFVTLLTAALMPLCCCSVGALRLSHDSCCPAQPAITPRCCAARHAGPAPVSPPAADCLSGAHPSPVQHPAKDGCACGNDKRIRPLGDAGPLVLLSAPTPLIPASPASALVGASAPRESSDLRPLLKRARSLLRLHCALIV